MKHPMTVLGQAQLRKELDELKASRSEISAAIGRASALGDLSENADYHANKNKQGMVEAKIRQIESKLANAQVIDVTKLPKTGRIVFGSTVTLQDQASKEVKVYQIVGEDESDVGAGKLSVRTPVARALISRNEGEIVSIKSADREIKYLVEKVEYT